ncbi:hypothetical protein CSUI_003023 [Cystoisospora suis]|uniref:Uncharacterized protein n=1 Tax=Cystoisospora suis TaxID=483139 RepID=A0A2C6L762_9APIC|nr:hypothetical protein CSUI_003023 [Cystoisospora suis]
MPTRSSSPFSSSSSSRRPSHAPSAFAPPAVQESPSQGREEEEEIRIHLRRASGVGPPLSPPLFYSYVQRQHHQEAPRRFSLSPLHTQAPPVVERTRRRRREEEKGVDPIWSLGCLLPLPSIDRAIEGDEVSSSSFCGGGGAGERRGVERRVSEEREERRGRGASSLLGDREEA